MPASSIDAPAAERAIRALERWPRDRPLAALISGPGSPRWSGRSILALPRSVRVLRPPEVGSPADARHAVRQELRRLLAPNGRSPSTAPSAWAGRFLMLSYDLGRHLEPAAGAERGERRDDRDWPLAVVVDAPDALVLDHASGRWSLAGDRERLPFRPETIDEAAEPESSSQLVHGPLELLPDAAGFRAAVARCVELVHAGDLFQANIARRISAPFDGSARDLAARALRASGAWFGAYLECGEGRCVVSMSPELFLELDPATRRIATRPIKGTAPASVDPQRLRASEKDAAELAMIVDLMRNDLGRVCRIGSIRVDEPRAIESHPTVHHAVAEVSGTLRDEVTVADLLDATFPPGSVTGAPKVRAMQVIDELEPRRRGPYCGAIGLLADDGSLALNVAIRTIALSGRSDPREPDRIAGVLDYWTGCGVVADSHPDREWDESVAKAEVLMRALER